MRARQCAGHEDRRRGSSGRWLGILAALLLPVVAQAAPFTGTVVEIREVHTLRVARAGRTVTVRLFGVEGPARGQAFHREALAFLRQVAFQQPVAVVADTPERAGRVTAVVQLPDGRDLSQALVQAGYAWHDTPSVPQYPKLAQLEAEARAAQRGLWAEAQPIPPWEWRTGRRPPAPAASTSPTAGSPPPGPVIGNQQRKVYSWPGCPAYAKVARKHRVAFPSREAAEQAGYRQAAECG